MAPVLGSGNGAPGRVLSRSAAGLEVATGGGSLRIVEIARAADAALGSPSAISEVEVGDLMRGGNP